MKNLSNFISNIIKYFLYLLEFSLIFFFLFFNYKFLINYDIDINKLNKDKEQYNFKTKINNLNDLKINNINTKEQIVFKDVNITEYKPEKNVYSITFIRSNVKDIEIKDKYLKNLFIMKSNLNSSNIKGNIIENLNIYKEDKNLKTILDNNTVININGIKVKDLTILEKLKMYKYRLSDNISTLNLFKSFMVG